MTSINHLCFEIRGSNALETLQNNYTMTNLKVLADDVVVYTASTVTLETTSEGAEYARVTLNGKVSGFKNCLTIQFSLVKNDSDDDGDQTSPIDLTNAEVSLSSASETYTGEAITPDVTVTVENETVTEGYTVSYADADGNAVDAPVEVGTYTVTVTGDGTVCSGSASTTFEIKEASTATEKFCIGANLSWWSPDYAVDFRGAGHYSITVSKTGSIAYLYAVIRSAEVADNGELTKNGSWTTYKGAYTVANVKVYDGSTLIGSADTLTAHEKDTGFGFTVNGGSSNLLTTSSTVSTNLKVEFDLVAVSTTTALADENVTLEKTEYEYTGSAIEPSVTVKVGDTTLTAGTDYEVGYSDNTDVGTGKVTVTGIGSYTGTVTKEFTIKAAAGEDSAVTVLLDEAVQINSWWGLVLKTSDLSMLTEGGYLSIYHDVQNPGINVVVTGASNSWGQKYGIASEACDSGYVTKYTYDVLVAAYKASLDDANKLEIYVSCGSAVTVTKITYTAASSGSGEENPATGTDISGAVITLEQTEYDYTGSAIEPVITGVKLNDEELDAEAYTVSYENNTEAGTGKVVITGVSPNYSGTASATFTITDNRLEISDAWNASQQFTIELEYGYVVYDGTEKTPSVSIKTPDGTALVEGEDFTVDYTDNTDVGTATVTITGIGNYKGTPTKTFNILQSGSAYLCMVDEGWWPSVTLETSPYASTPVNGAGTYTLSWTLGQYDDVAGPIMMCYVDIIGAAAQWKAAGLAYNVTDVTVSTSKGTVAVNMDNVVCSSQDNGNFRIQLYNIYDETGAAAVDITAFAGMKSMTLTFILEEDTRPLIEEEWVKLEYYSVVYSGAEKKPAVTVKQDNTTLAEGTDYTVSYADNTEAGTATVTVEGIGDYRGAVTQSFNILKPGNAYLCYSDADWYPGVSLDSLPPITTVVSGAGTYTLSWDLAEWETAEGIMVFYIDIIGSGKTLSGYGVTSMTLTVDGTDVPVNVAKLNVGDLENNGNFRIEIYNNWGSTKNDCPIKASALNSVSKNVTVTFTLEAGKASVNNKGSGQVTGQATSGMWYAGSTYTAKMQYSDKDWYPGVEITGKVDANGTYNFSWNLADWEDASGIQVFYIDIIGAADQVHLTDLKVYADGQEVTIDMDKVLTGDLEGKGNYRIEIYNAYGDTASDSPIDENLRIYGSMLVTFSLEEGPDPVKEAEFDGEGFKATMVFNDADWWPQTSITTGVTGPGTYTMSWDLGEGETAEGVVTFYIDIFDAYAALRNLELTDLVILVDGEPIDIDLSKVLVGDLEGFGHYRIEIYNEYGATKLNPPIDIDSLVIGKNLTLTFTLGEHVVEEPTEPANELAEQELPAQENEEQEASSAGWIIWLILILLAAAVVIVFVLRKKLFVRSAS